MPPIPIRIDRRFGKADGRQPFRVGVPLPQGIVSNTSSLSLRSEAGEIEGCDFEETAHWPDRSVKWVLLEFVLAPGERNVVTYNLFIATSPSDGSALGLRSENTEATLTVVEDDLVVVFDKRGKGGFPSVKLGSKSVWSANDLCLRLAISAPTEYTFIKDDFVLDKIGEQTVRWVIPGKFVNAAGVPILSARLCFSMSRGKVLTVRCELHNPRRAMHKDGIWDLGDAGSVCFDDFSLVIDHGSDAVRLRSSVESPWEPLSGASATAIIQASSGGEQWDSPVHVNASGKVCNPFRGYQKTVDQAVVEEGDRAQPVVHIVRDNGTGFLVAIRDFWQNFPKGLAIGNNLLELGLFPSQFGEHFELQGGERKGHDIVFSFSDEPSALDWVEMEAAISVEPAAFLTAGVYRYSSADYFCPRYEELLYDGLDEKSGFVAKREILDEYGWRNFGDIYADHETLFHEDAEIFVSHYNNQYDPIFGFARQYSLTGDRRWYDLMTALARHVLDIDIYRTEDDRAEYNQGLFWHTDHYKKAYTCSHRTYSRQHYASDWSGDMGGGPGPEHCYTTGLYHYYLLTGDKDAALAVEGLADWITYFYEGTGTILERLKLTLQRDLKQFIALARGKKVFRYSYPLNRGVGNYIRALIDTHAITQDPEGLRRIETIIAQTFGPSDDISRRDLLDAEYTWFYIIFLEEIIRFMDVKRELGEFDQGFHYARNSLLHYARWMVEHESAYLSKPDQLLYPNDTWVAQEVRKANVLYAAYRYSVVDRTAFLERARYFRDYLLETLAESDTRHFARIQVILLQNHGPSGYMDREQEPYPGLVDVEVVDSCFYSVGSFIASFLRSWAKCVFSFSLKREIKWVKARFG